MCDDVMRNIERENRRSRDRDCLPRTRFSSPRDDSRLRRARNIEEKYPRLLANAHTRWERIRVLARAQTNKRYERASARLVRNFETNSRRARCKVYTSAAIFGRRDTSADCELRARGTRRVCKGSRATSVRAHGDPRHVFEHAHVVRMSGAHECHPAVIPRTSNKSLPVERYSLFARRPNLLPRELRTLPIPDASRRCMHDVSLNHNGNCNERKTISKRAVMAPARDFSLSRD